MAKLEDGWDDDMAWYSELEKEALKEAEGDRSAGKRDEEERLKEEAGMIYKNAQVLTETAYAHMQETKAEYHSETEEEEERSRRNY